MARILFLVLALGLLGVPVPAGAAPREVEVTATGLTRQEAITNGLVQALEQVRGVALGSASMARTELSSSVNGDERVSTIAEQQQSATVKLTGGFVSGYRVLSSSEGPPAEVQLSVVVEVFEPKGLGNETRRRIAVMAFSTPGASAARPAPIIEQLRDRVTAHLVQARRFAVVDRAQDGAYAREMRLITQEAPLAERVRLGQVIGADYIVTGTFRQTAATRSDRVIELTGEVVTNTTAGSAEADYQVLEVATRQIKFAGTARIVGGTAVDDVSARIAQEITQAIYPMRLLRFSDPANLVIGQGGDLLKPGQRFRAMVLGEAMIDPYTKEPLGQLEQEAGVVEIRRVDGKLSYAQLVSGRLPAPSGDDVQIVLRPASAASAAPVVARARARAQARAASAPTVTKLPYDP